MRSSPSSAALLTLLPLLACGQRALTELSADEEAVVFGHNELALDLLAAAPAEENLFIGSFSITSALGMTYAGAAGQTQIEMADVLHVNVPDPTFHAALGAITQDLNGRHKGYALRSGNRLWGQKRLDFKDDFLEITDADYGAALEEVDFERDAEAARRDINRWVSRQTKGHIEEAVQPGEVTAATRLALTNAMYFHADWAEAFDPEDTSDQDFTLADGAVVRAPMMIGAMPAGLYEDDEVSVLRLPYKGEELSFIGILPMSEGGLAELEEGLSVSQLDAWLARMGQPSGDVHVTLPKLSMRSRLSLNTLLSDLGMPSAFDPALADLSGMTDEANLSVSDVIHEAQVELDEEGTTAIAFTIAITRDLSITERREWVADHPFLFFIRDDVTGAILFMGRVADPSLAQPGR